MQVVQVKMEHVSVRGGSEDDLEGSDVVSQWISDFITLKPKGFGGQRNQGGVGDRVAAGKKGYVVTLGDKFFDQVGNDPFGASIELGGNAFVERRNLGRALHPLASGGGNAWEAVKGPSGDGVRKGRGFIGGGDGPGATKTR